MKKIGFKKAVWHVKKEDLSTVTIELDQIIYIESIILKYIWRGYQYEISEF